MPDTQCVHCGRLISESALQCPYCREEVGPHAALRRRRGLRPTEQGARWIHRGLLFMLLAGIVYYLLGPHSPFPMTLPFDVTPWVMSYGLPLLFVVGLGLVALGLIRRQMR